MPTLITTELVALDADLGADKNAVIRRLAGLVAGAGRATGAEPCTPTPWPGRRRRPPGLPGGIAIPHCRSEAVTEASLASPGCARRSTSARPTVPPTSPSSSPRPHTATPTTSRC